MRLSGTRAYPRAMTKYRRDDEQAEVRVIEAIGKFQRVKVLLTVSFCRRVCSLMAIFSYSME